MKNIVIGLLRIGIYIILLCSSLIGIAKGSYGIFELILGRYKRGYAFGWFFYISLLIGGIACGVVLVQKIKYIRNSEISE